MSSCRVPVRILQQIKGRHSGKSWYIRQTEPCFFTTTWSCLNSARRLAGWWLPQSPVQNVLCLVR